MVTKYVCVVDGCDFVTQDENEAMEHGKESHMGAENIGAKVTLNDDGTLDCALM